MADRTVTFGWVVPVTRGYTPIGARGDQRGGHLGLTGRLHAVPGDSPLLPQSFDYEARMYAYGRSLVQSAPRGRVEKFRVISHGGTQLRDMGELVQKIFSLLINIATAVRQLTLDDLASRAALKEAFPRFPLQLPKVKRNPRGTTHGDPRRTCGSTEKYSNLQ